MVDEDKASIDMITFLTGGKTGQARSTSVLPLIEEIISNEDKFKETKNGDLVYYLSALMIEGLGRVPPEDYHEATVLSGRYYTATKTIREELNEREESYLAKPLIPLPDNPTIH